MADSHLGESRTRIVNNEATSIANRSHETEPAAVEAIATPGRPKRSKKPKKFDDCHAGKRQKRESDASFFRSVSCDPLIRDAEESSRTVLEPLDRNVQAVAAPKQNQRQPINNNAAVASPQKEETGGLSDCALDLEPVNLMCFTG